MQTRAALSAVIAPLLLLACGPAARAPLATPQPCPAPASADPAPGPGQAEVPAQPAANPAADPAATPAPQPAGTAAPQPAANATAQPAEATTAQPAANPAMQPAAPAPSPPLECTLSTGEPLGDARVIGVRPGDWVRSLSDVHARMSAAAMNAMLSGHATGSMTNDMPRWLETERLTWPMEAFLTFLDPADRAAFVVLERVREGYCVRAVWGVEFVSNVRAPELSDVARTDDGVLLVLLEAPGAFNPSAASPDLHPFVGRRVVLAVTARRATVIADTQADGPFRRYGEHHWYFVKSRQGRPGYPHLVATAPESTRRWRFDVDTWTLVPLPPERPRSRKQARP